MATNYAERANRTKREALELYKAAPDTMRAFQQLMSSAGKDGALSAKIKELMALAIAISTRCEGCIVFHVQNAIRHGATREELAEMISVCVEKGGGPSTVYGAEALAAFDELSANSR